MKITKEEREALRKELAVKGYTPQDIALVMLGKYKIRIRLALRWAHGMTLQDVADEWNQHDASGRAPMSASRASDYERWPDGGKRPTPYALLMLAKIYGTTPARLLDDRDYAACNDKQLFEAVELSRTTDAKPTPPAQPQLPATPPPPPPEQPPAAKHLPRRKVVQGIGAAATSPYLESIELIRRTEASNVGPHTLDQLDHTIQRLGLRYLHTPLETMLDEVQDCRRYVTNLLRGKQTLAQKTHLYSVAGWLSILLGHLALDMGEHPLLANGHCTAALQLANEAGDAELTAWARGTQATIATHREPTEAVKFCEAGRQAAPAGSVIAVRLLGLEARAYGRMGERRPAEQGMAAAERAFDSLAEAEQPEGGIFSFDCTYLPTYGGTAYTWLQQPRRAQACAEQAIVLCDAVPHWPVARVLTRVDLATALGQGGDIEGAGKVGAEALHLCAAGRRTVPMARWFAELLKGLQPHHDVEAIRDLTELFHEVFPHGTGGAA